MDRKVVGMFDTAAEAQAAIRDLRAAGIDADDISIVGSNARGEYGDITTNEPGVFDKEGNGLDAGEGATFGAVSGGLLGLLVGLGALAIPGVGPVIAGGAIASALGGALIGAASGGIIGALVGAGIPEDEAQVYAEGLRRGGTMVMVKADDDNEIRTAAAVLQRHNAVDIDRRGEEYRSAGWSGYDANAGEYEHTHASTTNTATTNTATTNTTLQNQGEIKVPVVEEQLNVGKREVESGGVRVYTRVNETPVREQVTLRQEHVDVHRQPVDRPVTSADQAAFREGTVEVRERSEQAVVQKEARVTEEVHIKKDVDQRTETIEDTVRSTDVDVQQIPGQERIVGSTTTGSTTTNRTGDEGVIERNASKLGNAVERGTNSDIDNDGDVGVRDRRDNI